jgi:hypothetical protein
MWRSVRGRNKLYKYYLDEEVHIPIYIYTRRTSGALTRNLDSQKILFPPTMQCPYSTPQLSLVSFSLSYCPNQKDEWAKPGTY